MCEILIIAEHNRGVLADITLEMIGAGNSLKTSLGVPLVVATIAETPSQFTAELSRSGVDEVLEVSMDSANFDSSALEDVVCSLAQSRKSAIVLLPHSVNGMSYGPAVAARLGSGFASDVMGLRVDDGQLLATKSLYENKVHMEVAFPGKSCVALMLRGATFAPVEEEGTPKVTSQAMASDGLRRCWEHIEYIEAPVSDVDITKAEFIMSIGRGIQQEENVARFSELATKLNATLGCSRPLADAGWLPKPHQVGLSGKMAADCKVYLALGISGAVQHLHGMKHVDTIIAVNTDANAPIFNVATYGICADVFEFAEKMESGT